MCVDAHRGGAIVILAELFWNLTGALRSLRLKVFFACEEDSKQRVVGVP